MKRDTPSWTSEQDSGLEQGSLQMYPKVRLIPGRPRGPKSTTCFLREDDRGPRGRCEAKAEGGRG